VGGTSGIGEFTLKAFVQNTISPRAYLVGRNASAAERIIEECKTLNDDGKVEFIQADVSELREVDRVCTEIVKKEKRVNLLFQTQGNLNMRGRDGKFCLMASPVESGADCWKLESPEGLDRKFTLNYYSRMRFISNLLSLLRSASTTTPNFARSVSVLSAGHGGPINLDDLELKNTFSRPRCAAHSTTMNDFMAEELAAQDPSITFIHSFPGAVNTGLTRELPLWTRVIAKVLTPLISVFSVSADETGQRNLFHATSGLYPPMKPAEVAPFAVGVPAPTGLEIAEGANGQVASGGYLLNWNGDVAKQATYLKEDRKKGYGKLIREHTMQIFERVEKINQGRAEGAGS
jgi:NAD(P)-dependent dehydrogenase (short-subunit alcohol dehydrogenase family)